MGQKRIERMIKEMLMKARQKSNLSREKNAIHGERKGKGERLYNLEGHKSRGG